MTVGFQTDPPFDLCSPLT